MSIERIFSYLNITAKDRLPFCLENETRCPNEVTQGDCVGIVLVKPDAIKLTLDPLIVAIIEGSGFAVVYQKWIKQLTDGQIRAIYEEEQNKPWWNILLEFMKSGPVLALVVIGCDGVAKLQELKGNPLPPRNMGIRKMMRLNTPPLPQEEISLLLQGLHPQQNDLSRQICVTTLVHVPERDNLPQVFPTLFTKTEILKIKENPLLCKFLESIGI